MEMAWVRFGMEMGTSRGSIHKRRDGIHLDGSSYGLGSRLVLGSQEFWPQGMGWDCVSGKALKNTKKRIGKRCHCSQCKMCAPLRSRIQCARACTQRLWSTLPERCGFNKSYSEARQRGSWTKVWLSGRTMILGKGKMEKYRSCMKQTQEILILAMLPPSGTRQVLQRSLQEVERPETPKEQLCGLYVCDLVCPCGF